MKPPPRLEPRPLHVAGDPREDLAEDSAMWLRLLTLAWEAEVEQAPESLFYCLFSMRAVGLRLRRSERGWVLRPEVGGRNFESAEEYAEMKRLYLSPHAPALHALLARLAEVVA